MWELGAGERMALDNLEVGNSLRMRLRVVFRCRLAGKKKEEELQ
jgi:hypothetical protein